ncbi:hypothetical protein [Amycolatopsis sulphurea]|uniref:hypothetical protein n=1 Tax=Amycolatopsis sulphurea TaxID=76022 RepID=UPI001FEC24DF|nr:hypothetical protein [Amycolatopsis sulphurea]
MAPALVALAASMLPSHGFRPLRTADRCIRLLLTCAALLLLGPQILTPADGPWAGWQLIVANTYPLVTLALLLTAAYRAHRAAVLAPIRPTPARPEPVAAAPSASALPHPKAVSIKELAEYLGHADAGFTLRTYTHLVPSSPERARQAVDAVFARSSNQQGDVTAATIYTLT